VATAVTAVILAAATCFAWRQVNEARRLREAQFRPFVVLDFDVGTIPPLIFLTIANTGSVMARNVTFSFDPELVSSFDDAQGSDRIPKMADLQLFRNGIPTLPPGKQISILFDSWTRRADLPDAYTAWVRYQGEGGRTYKDEIRLDLAPYRFLRRVDRRGLHDIHKQLERIATELRRWSAPGSGLKVKSPEDIRREQEEWERDLAERAAGAGDTAEEGGR